MIEEVLTYSDYVIFETKQSRIDLDKKVTTEVGMRCPRCKRTLAAMDHGEKQVCSGCKLHLELWGNGLHCKLTEGRNG